MGAHYKVRTAPGQPYWDLLLVDDEGALMYNIGQVWDEEDANNIVRLLNESGLGIPPDPIVPDNPETVPTTLQRTPDSL